MRAVPRRLRGLLVLSAGLAFVPAAPAVAQTACVPLLCSATPAPNTPEPSTAPAPVPVAPDGAPGTVPATSASQVVSDLVDPQRTSHADDPALVAPLTGLWTRSAGGTVGNVVAGDGLLFATVGSSLKAYDAATGRPRWTISGTPVSSGLAYDAGRVISAGSDGLVARSATDGSELWRVPTTQFSVLTAPVAVAGRVYSTGVQDGGYVTALDAATGRRIWNAGGGPVGGSTPGAAVVSGDRVLVGFGCDNAASWDRLTGQPQWTASAGCSGGGSPVASAVGGRLYAPDDGHVWDQTTGAGVGSLDQRGGHPVFVGGLAVFARRGETPVVENLRAVDPVTGRTAWTRAVPHSGGGEGSPPIGVGNAIYLIQDGCLLAYDATTGRPLQRSGIGFRTGRLVPLGAGRMLAVSGGRMVGIRTALRPGVRSVQGYVATPEVDAGQRVLVEGRAGSGLVAGRPTATVEADLAPFDGRYRRIGSARVRVDGRFSIAVRSDRNARIRVRVGSRRALAGTVVVYPRVTSVRIASAGRTRFRVRYALRGPRSVNLGSRRVFVYHQQTARRLLRRLGTGPLTARGRGRASGSTTFPRLRSFASGDSIYVCIRGSARSGFGGGQQDRSCGRSRIRYR